MQNISKNSYYVMPISDIDFRLGKDCYDRIFLAKINLFEEI